jgi:uncharacterized protein YjbJ (UPF0337 family)
MEGGMVVELRKRRQECTDIRQRIADANVSGDPSRGFSGRCINFRRDEFRKRLLIEVPCRRQRQRRRRPKSKTEDITMSDDRTEGSLKKMKGDLKEGAGNLTGDSKLKSEGKADKAEGKIQNAVGAIKDAITGKKEP